MAGLDPREIQDVVDEPEQVLAAPQDLLRALPVPGGEGLLPVPLQELREPENGVEGRSQLVAHRREEVALGGARGLGGASRVAQLRRDAHVPGEVPDRLDDAPLDGPSVHDAQGPAVARADLEGAPGVAARGQAKLAEAVPLLVAREREVTHPEVDEVFVRLADQRTGCLSEQAPVDAVAEHQAIARVEESERVFDRLDRAREAIGVELRRRLDSPPVGDVPDGGADRRAPRRLHGAEADLDRDVGAIAMAAVELEPRPHHAGVGVRAEPAHVVPRASRRKRSGMRSSKGWPISSSRA